MNEDIGWTFLTTSLLWASIEECSGVTVITMERNSWHYAYIKKGDSAEPADKAVVDALCTP